MNAFNGTSGCFWGNREYNTDRVRMKMPRFSIAILILLYLVAQGTAIEKPQYEIVHSESDFEVRLYTQSTWMAAPVTEISFQKATLDGYHR